MVWGAAFLAVTLADTVRLFLRASDRSMLSMWAWGVWILMLAAPLAFAARERRRDRPVPPADAARNYLVLGYGTAIVALRVIEACLVK